MSKELIGKTVQLDGELWTVHGAEWKPNLGAFVVLVENQMTGEICEKVSGAVGMCVVPEATAPVQFSDITQLPSFQRLVADGIRHAVQAAGGHVEYLRGGVMSSLADRAGADSGPRSPIGLRASGEAITRMMADLEAMRAAVARAAEGRDRAIATMQRADERNNVQEERIAQLEAELAKGAGDANVQALRTELARVNDLVTAKDTEDRLFRSALRATLDQAGARVVPESFEVTDTAAILRAIKALDITRAPVGPHGYNIPKVNEATTALVQSFEQYGIKPSIVDENGETYFDQCIAALRWAIQQLADRATALPRPSTFLVAPGRADAIADLRKEIADAWFAAAELRTWFELHNLEMPDLGVEPGIERGSIEKPIRGLHAWLVRMLPIVEQSIRDKTEVDGMRANLARLKTGNASLNALLKQSEDARAKIEKQLRGIIENRRVYEGGIEHVAGLKAIAASPEAGDEMRAQAVELLAKMGVEPPEGYTGPNKWARS